VVPCAQHSEVEDKVVERKEKEACIWQSESLAKAIMVVVGAASDRLLNRPIIHQMGPLLKPGRVFAPHKRLLFLPGHYV